MGEGGREGGWWQFRVTITRHKDLPHNKKCISSFDRATGKWMTLPLSVR